MRQQGLPGRLDHHAESDGGQRVATDGGQYAKPGREIAGGLHGGDGSGGSDGAGGGQRGDLVGAGGHVHLTGRLRGTVHFVCGGADLDEQHGGQHGGLHRLGGVPGRDVEQSLLDHLNRLGGFDQGDADLAQHRCDVDRVVAVRRRQRCRHLLAERFSDPVLRGTHAAMILAAAPASG